VLIDKFFFYADLYVYFGIYCFVRLETRGVNDVPIGMGDSAVLPPPHRDWRRAPQLPHPQPTLMAASAVYGRDGPFNIVFIGWILMFFLFFWGNAFIIII